MIYRSSCSFSPGVVPGRICARTKGMKGRRVAITAGSNSSLFRQTRARSSWPPCRGGTGMQGTAAAACCCAAGAAADAAVGGTIAGGAELAGGPELAGTAELAATSGAELTGAGAANEGCEAVVRLVCSPNAATAAELTGRVVLLGGLSPGAVFNLLLVMQGSAPRRVRLLSTVCANVAARSLTNA